MVNMSNTPNTSPNTSKSMQEKKIAIVSAVIALVLVLGGLVYWQTMTPFSTKNQSASVLNSQLAQSAAQPAHETITAKHQYKNGNHIVAGEVNMPTPCDILTVNTRVAESFPEQVTIEFVSTRSSDVCAQVITPVRFRVDFKASAQAVIKATWNGQPVVLNLIPVSANENLENFQIYMKG